MSRILIVEDEQHIADGLRYNLEQEGHEASIAPDGKRALDMLLKEHRPADVVILDVMLPGKDGFAVASELRALARPGTDAAAILEAQALMATDPALVDEVLSTVESGLSAR